MALKSCAHRTADVALSEVVATLLCRSTGSAFHLVQDLGYFNIVLKRLKSNINIDHLLLNIPCMSINVLPFCAHILRLMQSAGTFVMFLHFIC